MLSYNGGRLRELCQVFARKMLEPDCTVGLTLSGALTPAGLGMSCLIPLIRAGFVDWIVSTGANLYHDTHYALDLPLHQSLPGLDDFKLREHDIIRIYDIVFDYRTLLDTDAFYRELLARRRLRPADEHGRVPLRGRQVSARPLDGPRRHARQQPAGRGVRGRGADLHVEPRRQLDRHERRRAEPGRRRSLQIDTLRDVNETAAIVYDAKRAGGTSGVLILGGGSPKNFILQTEPQIQEVLGLDESGTITSSRSPTPAPTPAASPAPRRTRR